ncbi:MAG TPA: aliphatic sulfonate ABC transporter, partial [Sutterella sp.]|nr:aliphatic sulfonate ABC transporter [Sutterella sp.]
MKVKAFLSSLFSATVLSVASMTATATDLNICYVKSPFNLQNIVMKENRMLENEFAGSDVKVIWHEINSGAKQAQALAAGALDVSAVMNTASLLLAVGVGNDLVITTGAAHPDHVFALVGKKGADFSVKDLKGKTIAGPRGTVLHQMLVAALKKEGMTMQDVKFVSMDPPKA